MPSSGTTADEARQSLKQTARETSESLKSTAGELKSRAAEAAARAKEKAAHYAQERKDEAARRIGSYGSAIHETAQSFEEEDPNIAWFTHRAAERLDRLAEYVRQGDWRTLRADAENVARRHPVAFFGGMFVAGLVVGNLVKAARPTSFSDRDESAPREEDMDTTYSSGQGGPTYADSGEPATPFGATAAGEI